MPIEGGRLFVTVCDSNSNTGSIPIWRSLSQYLSISTAQAGSVSLGHHRPPSPPSFEWALCCGRRFWLSLTGSPNCRILVFVLYIDVSFRLAAQTNHFPRCVFILARLACTVFVHNKTVTVNVAEGEWPNERKIKA